MQSISIDDVIQLCNQQLSAGHIDAAERLIHPALEQHHRHPGLLFAAGNIEFKKEHWAIARVLYERSVSIFEYPGVYSNLGAVCRRMHDVESSLQYLLRCIELDPTNESALTNLAAAYVNEGCPQRGIEWAEKALAVHSGAQKARWNLGLMQLESGDYANGFRNYRSGIAAGERMERFYDDKNSIPLIEQDSLPHWREFRAKNGRKPRLMVWGEQGIGDEIMFCSMLREAAEDFELIFECHPRLLTLFQASMGIPLYGTRKERSIRWPMDDGIVADAKCPIGDLAGFYRTTKESFDGHGPYLHAPGDLLLRAHDWLHEQAKGKKIVGFAWSGGVAKTNMLYRSIQAEQLKSLMSDPRIFPVCLEYQNATKTIESLGVDIAYPRAYLEHHDYAYTAAIVGNLDALVTVNTSVVHLSGAMGIPAYVLTPSKPAWRYGVSDELVTPMYWYPATHKLYRQQGQDWQPAIDALVTEFNAEVLK